MSETIASATAAMPRQGAMPTITGTGRPQEFYADGSAVPDLIAEHHRPEDLDIEGIVSLPPASGSDSEFFGEDGLTFSDVLDIINPLQHIPVISTMYRAMTGDEISPGARVAGGALYGGPIGAGVAVVNAMVEQSTGSDIGETIMTAFTGDSDDTAVAESTVAAVAGAATKVSEADPAIVGAGFRPASQIALAAAAPEAAILASAAPVAASTPVAARQPFGGMGALPFTKSQNQTNDPVAAILQARAAVPAAGPVPGLPGQGVTRPVAQAPQTPQDGIPNVSSRLADKLAALAGRSPLPERIPPEPTPEKRARDRGADRQATVQAPSGLPQNPFSQGPENMMQTLDRYQKMKQAEAAGISG